VIALDYAEGERRLRSDVTWCAMIFDVKLGSFSGLDLLALARTLHPNVPTLLMSGYHDNVEVMNRAYAMGSAFVNKPIGMAEIRRIVAEGLIAEAKLDDEHVGRTLLRIATSANLTGAEVEILLLALEHESVEGIIRRRGVTLNTHKHQVRSLAEKLGVQRLSEAARLVFTEANGERRR
jgi:DNA-binding NarL/FixJ family response regulator